MLYYLYPIEVLCKCIHNVKRHFTESHEIMLIFANLHLIGYINIVMICHLPHAL